jgi:hypothetical protein
MALTLHPVPGKAKSDAICKAFAAGAPRDAQGHVFYGVTDTNRAAWDAVSRQRSGQTYYLIDNSYFDKVRGAQFRVTKNRTQHSGLGASDCKRFDALSIEIQPWREGPGHRILAVEQSPLFMHLIAKDPLWLARQIDAVFDMVTWTSIRARPWGRNKPKLGATLQDDLRDADAVITHTSAAAVEAVLAGLEVFTSAHSAAFVVQHRLIPDRRQWAGVLADAQFTIEEMKDGTAWHMLHRSTP